jgi:hypothetical protein
MASHPTTAHEILAAMGGVEFTRQIGARLLEGDGDALSFQVEAGKTRNNANGVRIQKTGAGTFDMEFVRVRWLRLQPVGRIANISTDQLIECFREETGLCRAKN